MSTETEGAETGPEREHVRAVTVTSLSALLGIVAAVGSSALTADAASLAAASRSQQALLVVVAAIAVQPPLLKAAGLLKEDFGPKDMLFIVFMTFSMWFVAWGIMLSSGVQVTF